MRELLEFAAAELGVERTSSSTAGHEAKHPGERKPKDMMPEGKSNCIDTCSQLLERLSVTIGAQPPK